MRNAVSVDIGMPPARGRRAGVLKGQVDERGQRQATDRTERRDDHPAPVAQLADGDLAADLQADDEEEHRHRGVVDHVLQVQAHRPAAHPHGDLGAPELRVPGGPDVGPHQRGHRGDQ
jgi:hypothetical protein